MAKKKRSPKQNSTSGYFLKVLLYFILGTLWLRVQRKGQIVALPVGLPIGLLINKHEKLQVDQKIEIAILVVATFLSFFLPLGIVLGL